MKRISYFDGHCDTIYRCLHTGQELRENDGHVDLQRSRGFEHYVQVFALFSSLNDAPAPELPEELEKLHETYRRELEKNSDWIVHCRNAVEIRQAKQAGKSSALLSIEGGELLGCDPQKIEVAQAWGVQWINPTWNFANALSGSHSAQPRRGLSDVGREFVRTAQQAGILIDVSHLSPKGFWDLVDITERPIIASHSNSRAVFPHSRGLDDDQFRAIAASGGAVGMNFYGDFIGREPDMNSLIDHIEHYLSMNGEKTVALGGDLDGCDVTFPGMEGIQSVPKLWKALEARGYPRTLLEDIFYRNWMRVIRQTG